VPAASRSILFNASADRVFAVVREYDKYPLFLPEVKDVRILARDGNKAEVRFEVELIKRIRYTLRMEEQPPTSIHWSLLEGEIIKDNTGSWRLEPRADGKTQATYSVDIGVGPLVPKVIVNGIAENALPRMLEAFARRIESLDR
jgi:coenzyme Q-binding protein COQ10